MSEQSNVVSINYAPNPLQVRRRFNMLALDSLVGAIACAMVPIMLVVAMAFDDLYSLELIVIPFILELIVIGIELRQIRRNCDYQRGQSMVAVALLLTALAALPSVFLSATVQDRWGVNEPWAMDVLTVNKTWNPPAGARVVRARSMSPYSWYELKMPINSVASYQWAVVVHEGLAPSTARTVASLRALQEEDPDWWDFSTMSDPQALTFSGQTSDTYIFSSKEGKVLVREENTGS